jgi:cytochrome P450 family 6
MYRYTTDVIASCAFGINGYSLKDPNSEFRMYARKIFDFSVGKGLAALTAFTAPALKTFLKLKFLDDETVKYLRKTFSSTVEYR